MLVLTGSHWLLLVLVLVLVSLVPGSEMETSALDSSYIAEVEFDAQRLLQWKFTCAMEDIIALLRHSYSA